MRATACSSRAAIGALVVLLGSSGCITTRTGELSRGQLIRRTPMDSTSTDTEAVSLRGAQARWAVNRKTCTRIANEYEQTETEQTTSPDLTKMVVGAAIAGGGGALIATNDSSDDTVSTLGAVGLIGGGLVMLWGIFDGDTEKRQVPSTQVARQLETECHDEVVPTSARTSFTVALGGARRSGNTDADGSIDLLPDLLIMLREQSRSGSLRSLVNGRGISFRVQLGKAAPAQGQLLTRDIPDSFFESLAQEYERGLSGDDLSRWQNCRILAKTSREAFECHWSS